MDDFDHGLARGDTFFVHLRNFRVEREDRKSFQ